ncbi:DUF1259 domain-containing protein [Actinoplanes teichomyceticus]|uniref:Uncharacterized protein DUF1259 n=1 Tax=Actinoplanes teichomyceticus TaxID=1867 RepID=A0A561VLY4_ACTTI|nr:DUF1259 domain-containing protein [Actinoplanes teichomyceticus]TWG12597.1 uncharacterized protein DUF1259 [Actinoplanes teichomyceticus]GIF13964.1 hypothetical protein Ate01nite_39960 [Actinoplanes teichomyceticus]
MTIAATLTAHAVFYLHFWAHADAQALARTLRTAIDATRTAA